MDHEKISSSNKALPKNDSPSKNSYPEETMKNMISAGEETDLSCFFGPTIIDNTPCKNNQTSFFKKGITCSSTPLFNVTSQRKNYICNLSEIIEEESLSCESVIVKGEECEPIPSISNNSFNTLKCENSDFTKIIEQSEDNSAINAQLSKDCSNAPLLNNLSVCVKEVNCGVIKNESQTEKDTLSSSNLFGPIKKESADDNESNYSNGFQTTIMERSSTSNGPNNIKNCPNQPDGIINLCLSDSLTDLTVLKKDEISLLIDLPNDTISNRKSSDFDNQNLTISVTNCESIVYENIKEKTLDDILLGFEVEILTDEEEILRTKIDLKEFVSTNEDENRDNNNPEWELFKKLKTDDKRYKQVRQIWKNLAIPDLKKNLSTFNWRKRNSMSPLRNIEPIAIQEISQRQKKSTYDCTEVFDVGIQKLYDFFDKRKGYYNCDNDTSIFTSLSKRPGLEMRNDHRVKINNSKEYQNMVACVHERLKRHHDAKDEVKAVNQFYTGLKNLGNSGNGSPMSINHIERKNILDIEDMVDQYISLYPE